MSISCFRKHKPSSQKITRFPQLSKNKPWRLELHGVRECYRQLDLLRAQSDCQCQLHWQLQRRPAGEAVWEERLHPRLVLGPLPPDSSDQSHWHPHTEASDQQSVLRQRGGGSALPGGGGGHSICPQRGSSGLHTDPGEEEGQDQGQGAVDQTEPVVLPVPGPSSDDLLRDVQPGDREGEGEAPPIHAPGRQFCAGGDWGGLCAQVHQGGREGLLAVWGQHSWLWCLPSQEESLYLLRRRIWHRHYWKWQEKSAVTESILLDPGISEPNLHNCRGGSKSPI